MNLKRQSVDYSLLFITLALLCFGVIMVFSASVVFAQRIYNDSFYFIKREIVYAIIGILMLFIGSTINYKMIKKITATLLIITIILLLLVLLPYIGKEAGGAKRWLNFGLFWFQPAELAKLTIIIFLSTTLPYRIKQLRDNFLKGILPYLIVLTLICAPIVKQPDMSTSIIIVLTFFLMLFVAGVKLHHLLISILIGILLIGVLIKIEPYRYRRITAFFDKKDDIRGSDYQSFQAKLSFGCGGLLGVGLGNSKQKFLYLPQPHTDFIFPIIAEELGYIGVISLIGAFLFLCMRGFKVALLCHDTFGKLLAFGITTQIVMQALINMFTTSGIIPVAGMPLPIVSYGGSSLVITLLSIGILLNISYSVSKQ